MAKRFATGVPDERYERGGVPMTKREVRAVSLAYARVDSESRVLDIGAGTGGLTVEAARACSAGRVVAVERDAEALALLRRNVDELAPGNVEIVEGEAPGALAGLKGGFDAVLIGGHGGALVELLQAVGGLIVLGGRVVINLVGLDATTRALSVLSAAPWSDVECAQVSVSRVEPLGRDLRLVPLNPVFILSAAYAGEARP
jgi:precorrin-6Y C5,15-methyltransferase (decarboxylating) CbiT subunit